MVTFQKDDFGNFIFPPGWKDSSSDYLYSIHPRPDRKRTYKKKEPSTKETQLLVQIPKPIISASLQVNQGLWERIKQCPEDMQKLHWREFEQLVAELFEREGCNVELGPGSKDGGVDIIAVSRASIGELKYLVQCKQISPAKRVGVPILRQLVGSMLDEKGTYGLVATSSFFTKDALEYQKRNLWKLGTKDYDDLRSWIERLKTQ